MMEAQFESMEGRYEEMQIAAAQPEILSDVPRYQKLLREIRQLEPAVNAWRAYRQLLREIDGAKDMLKDPEMAEIAQEELKALLSR